MTAGDRAAERAPLADEVLLSDELVEAPRPHARRERLSFGWWLEERFRPGASGAWSCGRHRGQSRTRGGSVGLPELDLIALGVEDAREPPNTRRIPLGVRDDLDAVGLEGRDQGVESVDPEVEHPLLAGREVVGVRCEGREDGRAGLLFPDAHLATTHAQMLGIPGGERLGVPRPE